MGKEKERESKYESSETREFRKWGLKEKTLSMLKSFMDKIGRAFDQVQLEDLQCIDNRVEEIRRRYF